MRWVRTCGPAARSRSRISSSSGCRSGCGSPSRQRHFRRSRRSSGLSRPRSCVAPAPTSSRTRPSCGCRKLIRARDLRLWPSVGHGVMDLRNRAINPNRRVAGALEHLSRPPDGSARDRTVSQYQRPSDPLVRRGSRELGADARHRDGSDQVARIACSACPDEFSAPTRCAGPVDLRDEPFRLRERVLQSLTLAFGNRRNADGTIDLWAEVPASAPR
jgi:hypothetical protein